MVRKESTMNLLNAEDSCENNEKIKNLFFSRKSKATVCLLSLVNSQSG